MVRGTGAIRQLPAHIQGDGMKWFDKGFLYCLLAMLCVAAGTVRAQESLQLTATSSEHTLAAHTRYYHDPAGKDHLASARQHLVGGKFQPLPDGNTSFGYQDGAYWFHVNVLNVSSADRK